MQSLCLIKLMILYTYISCFTLLHIIENFVPLRVTHFINFQDLDSDLELHNLMARQQHTDNTDLAARDKDEVEDEMDEAAISAAAKADAETDGGCVNNGVVGGGGGGADEGVAGGGSGGGLRHHPVTSRPPLPSK